ncbi:Hypothetical predicted protein, partial [Paramuricea clavata]
KERFIPRQCSRSTLPPVLDVKTHRVIADVAVSLFNKGKDGTCIFEQEARTCPTFTGERCPNGIEAQQRAEHVCENLQDRASTALGMMVGVSEDINYICDTHTKSIRAAMEQDITNLDDRCMKNYSLLISLAEKVIELADVEGLDPSMAYSFFMNVIVPYGVNKYQDLGHTSFDIKSKEQDSDESEPTVVLNDGVQVTSGGVMQTTSGGLLQTSGGSLQTTSGGSLETTSGGSLETSGGSLRSSKTTSGGSLETSGGSLRMSGGFLETTSGRSLERSGGSLQTSGGSLETSGGSFQTSGGCLETTSGRSSETSGGSLETTSGGSLETSGGSLQTSGGSLETTSGGSLETSGGSLQLETTSGRSSETSGGSLETTSGGFLETSGGSLQTSGGSLETTSCRCHANNGW